MLISFLKQLFGDSRRTGITPEQRDMAEINADLAAPLVKEQAAETKISPASIQSQYANDIRILEEKYGKLEKDLVINLTLHEALELLPRKRRRSDAYQGLKSELKRLYGVTLNVGGNNNTIYSENGQK